MERDDVSELLGFLATQYPNVRVTHDMMGEWTTALIGVDATTAMEAARECVRYEQRWPTTERFAEYVSASRSLAEARRSAASQPEPEPEPVTFDAPRGARAVGLIREALNVARAGTPMTEQQLAEAIAARGLGGEPERTYRCRECLDLGWVTVEDERVRPCSLCNSGAYELWTMGHYRPNHSCEVCRPSRAGAGRR